LDEKKIKKQRREIKARKIVRKIRNEGSGQALLSGES